MCMKESRILWGYFISPVSGFYRFGIWCDLDKVTVHSVSSNTLRDADTGQSISVMVGTILNKSGVWFSIYAHSRQDLCVKCQFAAIIIRQSKKVFNTLWRYPDF